MLKRMSNGVEAQFSWTWSKSLDTRSYDPSLTIYGTGDVAIAQRLIRSMWRTAS